MKQEEVMEKVEAKNRKEKPEQMKETRLVRTVYTEEVEGKRPRGLEAKRNKWKDMQF